MINEIYNSLPINQQFEIEKLKRSILNLDDIDKLREMCILLIHINKHNENNLRAMIQEQLLKEISVDTSSFIIY